MRSKISRATLAIILVALALSISYVISPPPRSHLGEYRYSAAAETVVDVQSLFLTLEQSINQSRLEEVRSRLGDLARYSAIIGPLSVEDDPLPKYLEALAEFSDKLDQIKRKLDDANRALSAQKIDQAIADLEQLERLRSETRSLPRSLHRLLDSVAIDYEVDTSAHQRQLEDLEALFQEYSMQIDQLRRNIRNQQALTATVLTLNASKSEVYVTEAILVSGHLATDNGTALVGRNVTISFGINTTVVAVTDERGVFNVSASFPVELPSGPALIQADFEPGPADANLYLPSHASLVILVAHYPSLISAYVLPAVARPTEIVEVRGNLTSIDGTPLSTRLLIITLGNMTIGNATTTENGQFTHSFAIPTSLSNGTHFISLTFNATNDRFAATGITLPLVVELITTQVRINLDRALVLSGTPLTVNATVKFGNETASTRGNVTIYVDDVVYAVQRLDENGSFRVALQPSLGLSFGSHAVSVVFAPDDPWVQGSTSTVSIYVVNTPFIVLAIAAVPTLTFVAVRLARRKAKPSPVPVTQPLPSIPKPVLKEEHTPERLMAAVLAERDHTARVRKSYLLARTLIDSKLGETSRGSETHREYLERISKRIPTIRDTLERLVEIFELTEYGPDAAEKVQSQEAAGILLKLREELQAVD